jgi:hypothetical protein
MYMQNQSIDVEKRWICARPRYNLQHYGTDQCSENMDMRGLVVKRDSRMPMDADPCRGGGPPSPA